MKPNASVNIGKIKLKNPVMVASGTFGYASEFSDFINLNGLGAVVTKTITLSPRSGNAPPRTCETPAGMLNSIGLENPGWDIFVKEKLPFLRKINAPLIVSIAAEKDINEFAELVRKINKIKDISAIELNISCPNVKHHGPFLKNQLVAQDENATYEVVSLVRKLTPKTIITKLSPNVTSVADIALAAEKAGSDAVSLINTLTGMSIDIKTRKPKIAAGVGGLSGPAIRPIAVRMVWQVYKKIKLPIIGMGGIIDSQSALEFIIAGASAVAVGTGNFVNPSVAIEIAQGIRDYLTRYNFKNIDQLKGALVDEAGNSSCFRRR